MLKSDLSFQGENPAWMQFYYDICGNTPLKQAEIVVVTDLDNDQENTKKNVALVNQIWQGHLVLVEEVPFGKEIKPKEHRVSQGINRKISIIGWDHPQFKERADFLNERAEKINSLIQKVQEDLQEENFGLFLKKKESFGLLLNYGSERTQQQRKVWLFLMNGMFDAFRLSVNQVIEDIKREHQTAVYELYAELWQKRLHSLIVSIEHGIKFNKKVIVLVSGSFVIPNPKLKGFEFRLTKIESYLQKNKFVIINAKHSLLAISNQPSLWPQSLKLSSSKDECNANYKIILPKSQKVVVVSHWFISKKEDLVKNEPTQVKSSNGLLEKKSLDSLSTSKQELIPK